MADPRCHSPAVVSVTTSQSGYGRLLNSRTIREDPCPSPLKIRSAYRLWLVGHDMSGPLADAILDAMVPTDWSNVARRDEMTAGFAAINGRLDEHDDRFDQIDQRFEQIDRRFEQVDRRLDSLTTQATALNEQMQAMSIRVETLGAQVGALTTQLGNMAVQIAAIGTQTGRTVAYGFGTMLIGFVSVIITVVLTAS